MENQNPINESLPDLSIKKLSRFFSLYGERFDTNWLFRYGFWRLIYFGLIAKFGIVTVNKKAVNGMFISYGTAVPLQDLWEQGYRVRLVGYIFNEPILEYTKDPESN